MAGPDLRTPEALARAVDEAAGHYRQGRLDDADKICARVLKAAPDWFDALHLAGLSPRRRASTIATPSGQPKESAHRLARAIKEVLRRAISRSSKPASRGSRFRVYDREGDRCTTGRCKGIVRRFVQAGRSTFYCPDCQQ